MLVVLAGVNLGGLVLTVRFLRGLRAAPVPGEVIPLTPRPVIQGSGASGPSGRGRPTSRGKAA